MDEFSRIVAQLRVQPLAAATRLSRSATLALLAVCCCFVLATIVVSWVGFLETDDLAYADAADSWLFHTPFLGDSHWALRHTIVLPLAAAFAVAGHGEVTLALPMLFYGLGLLLLMGVCVERVAGPIAGVIAPLLIASVPTFALGSTFAATDVPEAFFVLASFWTFYFASGSGRRWALVLSGLLAGCSFITRETTVALMVPYAILFLIGYGKRQSYLWLGAGFVVVVGADFLYLYLMSGDPFWRLHVTQRGVAGDNPYNPNLRAPAGMMDPLGFYALPRYLQAVLVLFASPTIGFLAWFGVPAAVFLTHSPAPGVAGAVVRLFTLLAICWFLILSFVFLSLWIIPRYQLVTLCALAVPSAVLLDNWLNGGHPRRAAAVLGFISATGLLLSAASDHDLMYGERALVSFARHTNEPVRTDTATLEGSHWLLQAAGADSRVTAGPPIAGGLYFVNHNPRRRLPSGWKEQDVPPGSLVVATYVQPPSLIGMAAAFIGLDRLLPEIIWRKIQPNPRRAEAILVP